MAIALIVGIVSFSNSSAQKLKKQLTLGDKYLSELAYEQAVTAFKAALDIEPNSEEAKQGLTGAYSKWATSLVDASEFEKTIEVLNEAISVLPESETLIEQRVETYLSWAEYYANSSDYENAIKVAKEGYDVTGDSRFLNVQKKYEKLQQIEAQNKEKSDYLASKKAIFDKMFAMIEAGEYESAGDYSSSEEMHSVFTDPFPGELIYDENGLNAELSGKGYGVYRKDEGTFLFYCGDYLNGARNGNGVIFLAQYDHDNRHYFVYEGEWSNNKPDGQGTEVRRTYSKNDKASFLQEIISGHFSEGLEDGDMVYERIEVDGRHPVFNYSSEMGVRKDITVSTKFRPLKENQFYYSVDESNDNWLAVDEYGTIHGVLGFSDW